VQGEQPSYCHGWSKIKQGRGKMAKTSTENNKKTLHLIEKLKTIQIKKPETSKMFCKNRLLYPLRQ